MFESEVKIRVRYAETDQMGYVYYGNYATYFEVARVETLRQVGFSYKQLEENGTLMPVLELKTKFIKPAKYDQLIRIKTIIPTKPGMRIVFNYEVYNEDDVLLNIAETTLVFIDFQTHRPKMIPEELSNFLFPYFAQ